MTFRDVIAGLLIVFLVTLHSTSPCGITTHIDIAYRAAEFFDITSPTGETYGELIKKHDDAFQAAAAFPDTFYPGICAGGEYHDVSEDTHWTPFLEAGVKYIRDTYNQTWSERAEKLVVFLLGVAQHQIADVTWHNLGVRQGFLDVMAKTNFHGRFGEAHPHGDFGGDVVTQVETVTDYQNSWSSWYLPVEDLLGIYRVLYDGEDRITSSVISSCSKLMHLGRFGENLGAINLAYQYYALKSPFLTDRMQDYFLGGMDDMSAWTTHVWGYTAKMIQHGTQICDLTENPVYIQCNNPAELHQPSTNVTGRHKRSLNSGRDPQATVTRPHERTGRHHADFLASVIGVLREEDVLVESVEDMGAVRFSHSQKLQEIYDRALIQGAASALRPDDRSLSNNADQPENMQERHKRDTSQSVRLLTVNEDEAFSRLGESLVTADLNGDGYDDVIIGAPLYSKHENYMAGRVYVKYGSPDDASAAQTAEVADAADVVLEAVVPHGRFGTALAVVDMNADGFPDLAVSAPMEGSQELTYRGSVYIYYGQSNGSLSLVPDLHIYCTSNHCNMGWSLAGGDVNADGVRDLVIGCPFAAGGGDQRGMVGAVYGKHAHKYEDTLTENEFDWEAFGDQDWSWFGFSVTVGGDWLAVGAPQYRMCARSDCLFTSSDTQAVGQVALFRQPLSGASDVILTGSEEFGQFGYHVALSGEGSVLAVGALSENAGSWLPLRGRYQEGRVYLYDCDGRGFRRAAATLKGDKMLDRFGQHIKIADVNNDDIDDVMIGAPLYTPGLIFNGNSQQGRVYIFHGKDKRKPVGGISNSNAADADVALTLHVGRSRFGSSFGVVNYPNQTTQLAVGSMNSNQAARLGGAVSYHRLSSTSYQP